jgi:hypothetical protein
VQGGGQFGALFITWGDGPEVHHLDPMVHPN